MTQHLALTMAFLFWECQTMLPGGKCRGKFLGWQQGTTTPTTTSSCHRYTCASQPKDTSHQPGWRQVNVCQTATNHWNGAQENQPRIYNESHEYLESIIEIKLYIISTCRWKRNLDPSIWLDMVGWYFLAEILHDFALPCQSTKGSYISSYVVLIIITWCFFSIIPTQL